MTCTEPGTAWLSSTVSWVLFRLEGCRPLYHPGDRTAAFEAHSVEHHYSPASSNVSRVAVRGGKQISQL